MKRYIVDKKAADLLNINVLDAITELGSAKIITDEPLSYKHIPYISVVLSENQLDILKENGIFYEEESKQDNMLLAENTGYEKLRTLWVKTQKKALSGQGVKVGVMDTGCNISVVPFDFGYNFINNNTNVADVFGHGTVVSSVIKHPTIGNAPDCELHILKVITDTGVGNESAILAGIDYTIDNQLDVVNLSWTFSTTAVDAAIIALAETNCAVVAASGNSSFQTTVVKPACLPGVVAVNAVNSLGQPAFFNVDVPTGIPGMHGVTVACNGVASQSYNASGNFQNCFGTSCSSPFFAGIFAMYKEELGISDNQRILQYILSKARKFNYSDYYGLGIPTF